MNWKPEEITFFPTLVVRTPALPFSSLAYGADFFQKIMDDDAFSRALYLANPSVFQEAEAWLNGKNVEAKREKKLKRTLFNYWTRMHSNCTPFGFFANVSSAHWGAKTQISIPEAVPELRVDMQLLAHLVNYFGDMPGIRQYLRFYPNNTRYVLDDKIRYNEMYFEGEKMRYRLSAVENSPLLTALLEFAKPGKTIGDLCDYLCDQDEFTREEVLEFIEDLIQAQLLFSELALNVTGHNPIDVVVEKIQGIAEAHHSPEAARILDYLNQLNGIIRMASEGPAAHFKQAFERLHAHFAGLLPNTDARKMIQVDCFLPDNEGNTIHESLKENLYEAIKILSSFKQNDYVPKLESFKRKFQDRYENAVMPLMEVLDTESGISFGDFSFIDENIFSSEITIFAGNNQPEPHTEESNRSKTLLYKKYMECLLQKKDTIHLTKEDFEDIDSDISKMASTCQLIFEYFDQDSDLVSLITVGNSCAGNLISRFAHGSEVIRDTLYEIAEFEKSRYAHSAVAEIIHIPEYRMGNLTFRPSFRDYEIPIVTQSALPEERQILLEDIYVTVQGDRIVLISKSLGKYVIPKLSNAHNYGNNTLPVYQFLSELSYQHLIPSLKIDRGVITALGKHIPRIQYKNIILSKALWLLQFNDIKPLYEQKDNLTTEAIDAFRSEWNLPLFTEYISQSARSLIIRWDSPDSVQHFLLTLDEEVKSLFIVEFPFEREKMPFRDAASQAYNNQVIAFFMNNGRKTYNNAGIPPIIDPQQHQRTHFPCDKWVYFKVYCGYKTYNQLLPEVVEPLVNSLYEEGLINKWFFLPYNDPGFHLRIRFQAANDQAPRVIEKVMAALRHPAYTQAISKVLLDTYQKELERYGAQTMDIAETLFSIDSDFVLNGFEPFFQKYRYYLPFLVIKQMDTLLSAFELPWPARYDLVENIKNSYASEFSVDQKGDLKMLVDKKINSHRKDVEAVFNHDYFFMEAEDAVAYQESLSGFEERLRTCFNKHRQALTSGVLNSFLRSILHMHAIRCFTDRPRQNELFVYHSMYTYYKKQRYIGATELKVLEKV